MSWLLPLSALSAEHRGLVGSKALRLAELGRQGVPVADGFCLTTEAYRAMLRQSGLLTRIGLELERLPLSELRWEELWDTAQRIRSLFLTTPLPPQLSTVLQTLPADWQDRPLAVRSSSPQEDQAGASFAGLHDSFLNSRGEAALLEHIRRVWASLWSDGALLYRHELKLDLGQSAMAVLIQPMIDSEVSGVAFSQSPQNPAHCIIEAVYGLNQALVDGTLEPDRWQLERHTGTPITHHRTTHLQALRPTGAELALHPLSPSEQHRAPLTPAQLLAVFTLAERLEQHFGTPQDLEWTLADGRLYLLQSRPITTLADTCEPAAWKRADKRPWYLSLKRSLDTLEQMQQRIETTLLPEMKADAARLATIPLTQINDRALAAALETRQARLRHWQERYWDELIPFAHGARLFGALYNERLKPADPFEFTALLTGTEMAALQRNEALATLADTLRAQPELARTLDKDPNAPLPGAFDTALKHFLQRFGQATFHAHALFDERANLIRLLLELARQPAPAAPRHAPAREQLTHRFLKAFAPDQQTLAQRLLAIGRASYRWRDDDNLILAAVENELLRAMTEARQRLQARGCGHDLTQLEADTLTALLRRRDCTLPPTVTASIDEPIQRQARPALELPVFINEDADFVLRARQLVGQPAGAGLAEGPARVISGPEDLFAFRAGEILVCDAIDPNMTFIVPLASAIVERRGGMLVHGAIIAREYGIPCVTGVLQATQKIQSGDRLTVDGYLGIVTRHEPQ